MDTARRLHLLASGDLAAWPDLSRDLERRADALNAAEALRLLLLKTTPVTQGEWMALMGDVGFLPASTLR